MLSINKSKFVRSLHNGKFRKQNERFIVQGPKIVDEILNSAFNVETLFATEEWFNSRPPFSRDIECIKVTEQELKKISTLKTPNSVLAVVCYKDQSHLPDFAAELVVVLDDIRDPGNLGTIIRTADWFGIRTIICSEESTDVYNPKVVQASMGSIIRVNVIYHNLPTLFNSIPATTPVYGAVLNGENIYETTLPKSGLIIIGNESHGLSDEVTPFLTHKLSIPSFSGSGSSKAESLNASVATAVILSEFARRS